MSSSVSTATPSRPHLTQRPRVVGVVAHQRRHVERGREPGLTVVEQVAEALVGLLRRPEPPRTGASSTAGRGTCLGHAARLRNWPGRPIARPVGGRSRLCRAARGLAGQRREVSPPLRRRPGRPPPSRRAASGRAPWPRGQSRDRPTSDRGGRRPLVAAYVLWGVFPLYFPLLEPAGALEILAHRSCWSLLFVAGVLTVGRRLGRCAPSSPTAAGCCCWPPRRS